MRKETFPEDEADWIMVDRESPSEITNLPENDVASFSSGDQCWSIEKAKGSETDDVKKIIPTMPKKTIKPGNDPVDPSQDKQTTSSSDHHKVTSFSPKQAVVNSEPSQSNYVCGKLPPTPTDNEVSRQWDPKMVVPRTNTTSLSDLPQLFPHLSKYQIEDWMRRDPRPHEMAFIGEGAVSSARDYKEPLEKPLPRVRAPQQDANSAVTTEPDSGQTVYPNDSDSSDNDSS